MHLGQALAVMSGIVVVTTVTGKGEARDSFSNPLQELPEGSPFGAAGRRECTPKISHYWVLKKIRLAGQTLALQLHQSVWGALETGLARSDGCWTTGLASQNPTSLSPAPSGPFRNGTAQFYAVRLGMAPRTNLS